MRSDLILGASFTGQINLNSEGKDFKAKINGLTSTSNLVISPNSTVNENLDLSISKTTNSSELQFKSPSNAGSKIQIEELNEGIDFQLGDLDDIVKISRVPNSSNKRIIRFEAGFDGKNLLVLNMDQTCGRFHPGRHEPLHIKKTWILRGR